MNHTIIRGDQFIADVYGRARWYAREAGLEVAQKFERAVAATVLRLARNPTVGRLLRFKHPNLMGLRSLPSAPPFGNILIFYRVEGMNVYVFRLMHGARDLGRRLLEPND
jgi:plasmid stabilization system protein ParE